MSRCLECGKQIKTRVDFCSYICSVKHFKGVVGVALSEICTRDLVAELRERDDVCCIVNDRSSATCVASIDGGEMLVEDGEHIILMVKGLY